MNVIAFGFLLLALSGVSTGAMAAGEPPPACRLDNSLKDMVSDGLGFVVREFKRQGHVLPFTQFVVNPHTDVGADVLRVFIVKDGTAATVNERGCLDASRIGGIEIDGPCVPTGLQRCSRQQLARIRNSDERNRFGLAGECYVTNLQACTPEQRRTLLEAVGPRDAISITGGCFIDNGKPVTLRCSAGALKILQTETASSGQASAAVLFVLAHELYHAVQNTQANFLSVPNFLNRDWSVSRKTAAIRDKCRARDAFRAVEQQADDAALKVLENNIDALNRRLPDHISRLYHVDQIGYAASYFGQWDAMWPEFRDVTSVASFTVRGNTLPIDSAKAKELAVTIRCDIETPGVGRLAVPIRYGQSHPSPTERMQRVSSELTSKLRANAGLRTGAAGDLQTTISELLLQNDQYVDDFYAKVTDAVCEHVEQPSACAKPPKR